jgi:hypothetical protein
MTETINQEKNAWSTPRKILTLFVIFYLLIYMFPEPFKDIPGFSVVVGLYTQPFEWLVLWFGKSVLGISTLEKITQTGSGDTTFEYVRIVVILIMAFIATALVMSISKRKEYQSWFHLTWIYCRYYLGLFLIVYGFIKLFEGQFPTPYLGRLEQNYGDSSPMGLMWTFMGASKAYTFFGGLMEFVAGCLLLFRRTTIAGGIMAFGVMLNVAIMNYCYDVCVKLFSTHLVLISIFILSPYLKHLFDFIFLQKSVQLKIEPLQFQKKWQTNFRKVSKIALLCLCAIMMGVMYFEAYSEPTNNLYSKSFNGSYKVVTFIQNRDTLPTSHSDTLQWSKIIMEDGFMSIRTITDRKIRFEVKTDTIAQKISIIPEEDSTKTYQFDYKRLPNQTVVFKGKMNTDTLEITTKQKKKSEYLLNATPFKWISEYPYNR